MRDAYRLGASLYVPAVHQKLLPIFCGEQYPGVRSLIACTEDAVSERDLPQALANLRTILPSLPERGYGPLRFIRPRDARVLSELLQMRGVERIHGFVLPKADTQSLPAYEALLANRDFWIMPTLETVEVMDVAGQRDLRLFLQSWSLRDHLLTLRVGGNDLMRNLAMKRVRGATLYESPVGLLAQQLILSFRPHGFRLTAPVFDFVDDPETLLRETQIDVAMGFIGKTAIHPSQVNVIEQALLVREEDVRAAREVLSTDDAVFKYDGAMFEGKVHAPWAKSILARSSIEQ